MWYDKSTPYFLLSNFFHIPTVISTFQLHVFLLNPLSPFSIAIMCMGIGTSNGIWATYQLSQPWKKLAFFFPQQLSIANRSSPKSGTLWASPSSKVWDFGWLDFMQALWVQLPALWVHVGSGLSCPERLFHSNPPLTLALTVFPPQVILWGLCRGGHMILMSHLGLSSLWYLSLHISQLWVSVLITIYCKRNFSDEGWKHNNIWL